MAQVTIQVLEGLERGRVFENLQPPICIGREDDNDIRLNDERVSRFHAKIQEDDGRLILTDLDSTNGTRVNGRAVQMRVLRVGDLVSIGRCVLLIGSREQIAEQVRNRREPDEPADPHSATMGAYGSASEKEEPPGADVPMTAASGEWSDRLLELFPQGRPESPAGLSPLQRAQLSDLVAYVHDRILEVIRAAETLDDEEQAERRSTRIDWYAWQLLLGLEADLSTYLREIADPDA